MTGGGRSRARGGAVVVALAVIAALMAVAALRTPPAPARMALPGTVVPDQEPSLTAFIGDSYAAGTGATSPQRRWTTLVAADQGWRELNLARQGTGFLATASADECGRPACPNYEVVLRDAVRAGAAVVVVSGGQEDVARDPARVARAVRATYRAIREGLPDAEIIAVGPSAIEPSSGIRAIDAAVREAAAEVDATYVSLLRPAVIKPVMVAEDEVHVNNAGHAAIARRVIEGLGGSADPLLREAVTSPAAVAARAAGILT